MSRLNGSLVCCAGDVLQHRSNWDYYDETIIFRLIHFPKIWFEPSGFIRRRFSGSTIVLHLNDWRVYSWCRQFWTIKVLISLSNQTLTDADVKDKAQKIK